MVSVCNISGLTNLFGICIAGSFFSVCPFTALLKFIQTFLKTQLNLPKWDLLLNIISFCWLILIPITLIFEQSNTLIDYFILISMSFIIPVVALRIKQGARSATFIAIAFSTFLLGGLMVVFTSFGWLPYSSLPRFGIQLGSSLEFVLLSLALADRINSMNKTLSRQSITLSEQHNKLKSYSEQLETMVEVRTQQLTKTNSELDEKHQQRRYQACHSAAVDVG